MFFFSHFWFLYIKFICIIMHTNALKKKRTTRAQEHCTLFYYISTAQGRGEEDAQREPKRTKIWCDWAGHQDKFKPTNCGLLDFSCLGAWHWKKNPTKKGVKFYDIMRHLLNRNRWMKTHSEYNKYNKGQLQILV